MRSIKEIQETVAGYFKITVGQMKEKNREKERTWPRHVSIYLCLKSGYKNSSAVHREHGLKFPSPHAVKVVESILSYDKAVREQIREIKIELGMIDRHQEVKESIIRDIKSVGDKLQFGNISHAKRQLNQIALNIETLL